MKNTIPYTIKCLVFAATLGIASGEEAPPPSNQTLQEILMLSSSQFYTNFALIRLMLEGTWDQKVFEQFSFYDGVNFQLTKRYEEKLKGDKKWGSTFEAKNSIHEETYKKLKPLIDKKRDGGDLTDADRKLLEEIDKQIFESLIK